MKLNLILSILLVITLCLAAQAQVKTPVKTPAPEKAKTASYNELVEKVKKGDLTVDFRALRFAFADTENYSSGGGDKETRNKMFDLIDNKKYKDALKLAEESLAKNYVDMNTHFIAFAAHKELGNAEKAEFHRQLVNKLLNSIIRDKDGKTTATAFEVIVVDEEYTALRFLGYRVTAQALEKTGGHTFDVMSVEKNDTKEKDKFYFNVDKVFELYEKALK